MPKSRTALQRYLFRKDFFQKASGRLQRYVRYGYRNAFQEQARLLSNLEVNTIFDVGANVGNTVELYAKLFPMASIYAFEPTPQVFEKLTARFADRKLVHAEQLAVGESEKETEFYVSGSSDMNSRYQPNSTNWAKRVTSSKVNMTSLDAYCSLNKLREIYILKLDIQGGEVAALQGAAGLLGNGAIWSIYLECQIVPLYEKQPLINDIFDALYAHKYRLFNLYNFRETKLGQAMWCDGLFISPKMQEYLTQQKGIR